MQPESLGPNERDIIPPASRVKPWRRRSIIIPTVALTAMAGTGIGLATSSSPEPYAGKPTATYSAPEIPGQPHFYSATETFNALAQDPNIPKNGGTIDISSIAEQFEPSNYAMISSTDPHTKMQDTLSLVPSAPVMEVRFNKATSQFTYQVQTPKGLNNQELYQLLLPVMQNSVLLRTAFENNNVTRVAILLQSPLPDGNPPDYAFDEYSPDDWSSPKEGMQKTVYLFLPGVKSIDNEEISNVVRHETIHGLTGTNNMSEVGEKTAPLNSDERAKWNAVCIDMRDFSLQDAEQHKQSSIESLDELRNQFHNSNTTEIINEIISALQDGTFDRYQPQQGEKPSNIDVGKVPDCATIGPWETFARLMNDRGLDGYLNNVLKSNQAFGNIVDNLQTNWDNIVADQTIYSIFREGTYEKDSPEKLLGHEYENWDELITSTSDVCIAYPEKVAAMIKRLPPDRRAVALQLVHLSLTTLNEQVPSSQNEDFHKLIFGKLSTIISIVAQQDNTPASK